MSRWREEERGTGRQMHGWMCRRVHEWRDGGKEKQAGGWRTNGCVDENKTAEAVSAPVMPKQGRILAEL